AERATGTVERGVAEEAGESEGEADGQAREDRGQQRGDADDADRRDAHGRTRKIAARAPTALPARPKSRGIQNRIFGRARSGVTSPKDHASRAAMLPCQAMRPSIATAMT